MTTSNPKKEKKLNKITQLTLEDQTNDDIDMSVRQYDEKRLKDIYSFPATYRKAQMHKKANAFGYNSKTTATGKPVPCCPCCQMPINTVQISLSQPTTPSRKNIAVNQAVFLIDSGSSMFFTFIKMAISYLLLRFIIIDAYNLITSYLSQYCKLNHKKCSGGILSLLSSYNKHVSQDQQLINIVDILNLVFVVVSIIFFVLYRRYQNTINVILDSTSQTQDDYSLLIQNIPIFMYQNGSNSQNLAFAYQKVLKETFQQKIGEWLKKIKQSNAPNKLQSLFKSIMAKDKQHFDEKLIVRSITLCFDLDQLNKINEMREQFMDTYVNQQQDSQFTQQPDQNEQQNRWLSFITDCLKKKNGKKSKSTKKNKNRRKDKKHKNKNKNKKNKNKKNKNKNKKASKIGNTIKNILMEEIEQHDEKEVEEEEEEEVEVEVEEEEEEKEEAEEEQQQENDPNSLDHIPKKIQLLNKQYLDLSTQFAKDESGTFNLTHFVGKAFVSFQYQHYCEYLLRQYQKDQKFVKINDNHLCIQRAAHPSDVYWFNLNIQNSQRSKKVAISSIVLVMTLCISFLLILLLQMLQKKVDQITSNTNQTISDLDQIDLDTNQIPQNVNIESLNGIIIGYIITTIMAAVTNFVNSSLCGIVERLTDYQKHKTKSDQIGSLILKNVTSQFFNTAIIYWIISMFDHEEPLSQNGIVTKVMALVGITGFLRILTDFFQPAAIIKRIINCCCKKNNVDDSDKEANLFQIQLNKKMQKPQFLFAQRYSYYVMRIYLIAFYSYIAPAIGMMEALIIFIQFWIDKYNLLKKFSSPVTLNFTLSRMVFKMFQFSIVIFALGCFIFSRIVHNEYANFYKMINLVTLLLAVVYNLLAVFSPTYIESKLFPNDQEIEQKSYTYCLSKGKFVKDYWTSNPGTAFARQKDLNGRGYVARQNEVLAEEDDLNFFEAQEQKGQIYFETYDQDFIDELDEDLNSEQSQQQSQKNQEKQSQEQKDEN